MKGKYLSGFGPPNSLNIYENPGYISPIKLSLVNMFKINYRGKLGDQF